MIKNNKLIINKKVHHQVNVNIMRSKPIINIIIYSCKGNKKIIISERHKYSSIIYFCPTHKIIFLFSMYILKELKIEAISILELVKLSLCSYFVFKQLIVI